MIGFPRVLRDGFVTRRRNHTLIHLIEIRVEYRLLLIRLRYVGPQLFSTLPTSVPDVEGDDLARLGIHRDPDPLLVGFLLYEAPHRIGFRFQAGHYDLAWLAGA